MSTDTVTPLRQRMIEDMNPRKLGAHPQRSHIYGCPGQGTGAGSKIGLSLDAQPCAAWLKLCAY